LKDFEDSTLWRISAFDRVRQETGGSGFMRLGSETILPSTLLGDLRRLERTGSAGDVLEIAAACVRHGEAALLCLKYDEVVWPITVFPQQKLYHSPRDLAQATPAGFATLKVLAAEPPGVRAPGHWMTERVASAELYRPLGPLLWTLALNGPRRTLLSEIGGTAAYRLLHSRLEERPTVGGALGPALDRLHRESVSLRDIAGWPGMSLERASRLLNALYLSSALIVTRSHPAARPEPKPGLFGGKPRN
jgi:hypothetical protein